MVAALVLPGPAAAFDTHIVESSIDPSDGLLAPSDLAVDETGGPTDGRIYVADFLPGFEGYAVNVFDSSGSFLFQITGEATIAQSFKSVSAIAVDQTTGDLYVGDYVNQAIIKFDSSGQLVESFGEEGVGQIGVNDIPEGTMHPVDLSVDPSGNLLVSDYTEQDRWVHIFSSAGTLIDQWVPVAGPFGVDVDSLGRVFVGGITDVRVYDSAGNVDTSFGEGSGRLFVGFALDVAIDRSTDQIYAAAGERIVQYDLSGNQIDAFGTLVSGYKAVFAHDKVYVNEPYASDGPHVFIFKPASLAKTITGGALVLSPNAASVSGQLDPDGAGDVNECRFEYGLTASYGQTAPCSPATPFSSPADVTADLSGLEAGSTYHYRLVAVNGDGPSPGSDGTFTTPPAVKGVQTGGTTNLGPNGVTLNGSLDPDGTATTYYFEYGTDTSYGQTSAVPPGPSAGSAPGNTPVSAAISGLVADTTYEYRLVAVNAFGTTYGENNSFATPVAVKAVNTGGVTNLGFTSATLNGSLDPEGIATNYYFQYGTDTSYGQTTAVPPGPSAGSAPGATSVSAPVGSLDPETVYHYRLAATNAFGTTLGQDQTFKTLGPPIVSNMSSSDFTSSSALLAGKINPNGLDTTYHLEYGLSTSYGSATPESDPIEADFDLHQVSEAVSGLSPGRTYHFRLVATNAAGTTIGPDATFESVPNLPSISSSKVLQVASSSATLEAMIDAGGGTTDVVFQYGTDDSYGSIAKVKAVLPGDGGTQSAVATASPLTPGTTYHYRVVASNFAGSAIGSDGTFTTPGIPQVSAATVVAIGSSDVTLEAAVLPQSSPTTLHFDFGSTASYGARTSETGVIGSGTTFISVRETIKGLVPGSTYHVRAVVTNEFGVSHGPDRTIQTLPLSASPTRQVPARCKKGFVRKKGKCVKRKSAKRRDRRGGATRGRRAGK